MGPYYDKNKDRQIENKLEFVIQMKYFLLRVYLGFELFLLRIFQYARDMRIFECFRYSFYLFLLTVLHSWSGAMKTQ
jgi:hypothetical protein